MDIDLRNPPAFSIIPEGGLDLAPYAIYQAFFAPEYLTMVKITVSADLTVDCGPDWDAVTEGAKIIGFNRRWRDPLDGPDAELILGAHELAEGNYSL